MNITADQPSSMGNRPSAMMVGGVFLLSKSRQLTASPKKLEDFAVQIAVDQLDAPALATWLEI